MVEEFKSSICLFLTCPTHFSEHHYKVVNILIKFATIYDAIIWILIPKKDQILWPVKKLNDILFLKNIRQRDYTQ